MKPPVELRTQGLEKRDEPIPFFDLFLAGLEVWQAGYFNDRDRDFHRAFDRHMDAILEAFRQGKEPPVHARAGRRALALAYAAIESFESGKRVVIDQESI